MRRKKEYALYKGEEILITGTIDEIAQNQNVTKKTIMFYHSPAHIKRHEKSKAKNFKVLVCMEE